MTLAATPLANCWNLTTNHEARTGKAALSGLPSTVGRVNQRSRVDSRLEGLVYHHTEQPGGQRLPRASPWQVPVMTTTGRSCRLAHRTEEPDLADWYGGDAGATRGAERPMPVGF